MNAIEPKPDEPEPKRGTMNLKPFNHRDTEAQREF
jgi:hypothetical protein